MRWRPFSLGLGGATAGLIAWGGYLNRRRQHWVRLLDEAKSVHADWWRERHDRQGELLYVALGDSTAQGIGASKPWRSYVGELTRHIEARTGKRVRVVNLSVTSTTVYETSREQLPVLRSLDPDIVTVSIGANNMFNFNPQRFEKDLRRLYAGLPEHTIVSDLPSFLILPAERNVIEANRIIRRLAEEFAFPVAPLYQYTRSRWFQGLTTHVAGDFFHPNDRGYQMWASAFIPLVDAQIQRMTDDPPKLAAWPAPSLNSAAPSAAGPTSNGLDAAESVRPGARFSTPPTAAAQ